MSVSMGSVFAQTSSAALGQELGQRIARDPRGWRDALREAFGDSADPEALETLGGLGERGVPADPAVPPTKVDSYQAEDLPAPTEEFGLQTRALEHAKSRRNAVVPADLSPRDATRGIVVGNLDAPVEAQTRSTRRRLVRSRRERPRRRAARRERRDGAREHARDHRARARRALRGGDRADRRRPRLPERTVLLGSARGAQNVQPARRRCRGGARGGARGAARRSGDRGARRALRPLRRERHARRLRRARGAAAGAAARRHRRPGTGRPTSRRTTT